MECPFCKKIYDDEFNFCPWCGSEKPEINYNEDVVSFEKENEILDEETVIYEKEFKNIEEELNALQEDIKNYEDESNDFDEGLEIPSSEIRCPHCGSRKFLSDYERGEVVCTRCGLLLNEHLLDMGRPWMYTNEKNSREHLKFY